MSDNLNKASQEWVAQRATAIFAAIFLPAAVWYGIKYFVQYCKTHILATTSVSGVQQSGYIGALEEYLYSPFITIILIFTVIAIMHHGAIGMKIIIEDYIKHKFCRMLLTKLTLLFANFVIAVVALTLVTQHVALYVKQSHNTAVIIDRTNKK